MSHYIPVVNVTITLSSEVKLLVSVASVRLIFLLQ
jgi:hypothetical protein